MLCKHCHINPVLIKSNGKNSEFCSLSCRSHFYSKQTLQKRSKTNLKKYGVSNVFNSPIIKEKIKQQNIDRYGVEHACQSDIVKERMKNAWLKYSGGHPWSDPLVRLKREESLLKTYGVKHPILNEQIRQKIEQTNLSRYGFTIASKSNEVKQILANTINSEEVQQKRKATNLQRYGAEEYNQKDLHNELILLNDSTWLSTKVNELGLVGVASLLQVSTDTIRKYAKVWNIQYDYHSSDFEKDVRNYLHNIGVKDLKFNTRYDNKEIDIICHKFNIGIECNGSYWHSELNGRTREYHLNKTIICENRNIRLLHLWEHNWNSKNNITKSRIASIFNVNDTIYARKCNIVSLDAISSADFFNTTHIQGNANATISLGLEHNGKLVSAMSFSKSRFSKKYEYELLRFSNALNYNVVGGASKLFRHFLRTYNPQSIVSYSDRSWNTGNLYKMLGFKFSHNSTPNYWYTNDYKVFYSRVKFQKHKLKNLMVFDESLSEWDLMKLNGYDRIWDCGNSVWLFSN